MPTPSVLVITRDQDTTADLVVAELAHREVGVARMDLAEVPERVKQIAYLVPGRSHWTGALRGPVRDVDLAAVRAIWYRKPGPVAPHPDLNATERQWVTAEAQMGFGGLLTALPARWIDRPENRTRANQKPAQLTAATTAGLNVPETLLTNDADQARDFCRAHARTGVVYKPLTGGPSSEAGKRVALRTQIVTPDQITDGVARTVHLFQVRIPCAYAVRVTIVGHRLFAARIDHPDVDDAPQAVDWRAAHDHLTYTPVEVPADVATRVLALAREFGLTYAAPDFVVDHDGHWWFHGDLNPNGQWAWIEPLRPHITRALADELANG
ncbi:ATP-grasp ribosomal peptide maturase [Actinosynnema pretiosum subsp. pretiosum]|uniref:ATP-grasp ribosomal peptide maturase n=1 Tax=Actinosynnema pretiosum subsp. pretiosum TaxID=103721 RepID=A0AA45R3K5_9PSEU|nr:ATP-grasp ribosomal peptide maturase [Actinosynnema pretiosum subsp. pretiosum]